jgi:hypothetical protein
VERSISTFPIRLKSSLERTSSSIPLSPPAIDRVQPEFADMSDVQSGECSEVSSLPEIVVGILDFVDDIKPSSLVSKSFNQAYHSVQKKRGVRLTDFTLTDERLEQHGLSVKVAPEVSFEEIRNVRACETYRLHVKNTLTFVVPIAAGQKSSLGKEGSDRFQL